MSKRALSRWHKLTSTKLAESIHHVVGVEARNLVVDFKLKDGVWTQIAKARFGLATPLDCFWAYVLFFTNTDVRSEYSKLCGKNEDVSWLPEKWEGIQKGERYCFCQKPYNRESEPNMVCCDGCGNYYHFLCVGLRHIDAWTDWKCPFCKEEEFLPDLFNTSTMRRNLGAGSKSGGKATDQKSDKEDEHMGSGTVESDEDRVSDKVDTEVDEAVDDEIHVAEDQDRANSSEDAGPDENEPTRSHKSKETNRASYDHDLRESSSNDSSNDESEIDDSSEQESEEERVKGSFRIPADTWQKIKPRSNSQSSSYGRSLSMSPEWTNVFWKGFTTSINKVCVLQFTVHRCYGSWSRANHVTAYSKCNRKGCKMSYKFIVEKKPSSGSDCKVYVEGTGEMYHTKENASKRQLKGDERKVIVRQLKNSTAARVHNERYASTPEDLAAAAKGNLTSARALKIYQNCRSEALKLSDMHQDWLLDLAITMVTLKGSERLKGKERNPRKVDKFRLSKRPQRKSYYDGYIQLLSVSPFVALLYTYKQLEMLKAMVKENKNLVLHLDSTGTVTQKLPDGFDQTVMYFYAAVISGKAVGNVGTPVFEFISNNHTVPCISHVLAHFLHDYREYHNIGLQSFGIKRVEVDFSLALISSVLSAFEVGPTWWYLQKAYQVLVAEPAKEMQFVVHVCRTHALDFLHRSITKYYGSDDVCQQVLGSWVTEYLNVEDMYGFYRRAYEIIVLVGTQLNTLEVQAVIEGMKDDVDTTGPKEWLDVSMEGKPEQTPLKQSSPFGWIAHSICVKNGISPSPKDHNDSAPAENGNRFYRPRFLNYLLTHVLGYTPILTHILMAHNHQTFDNDTNGLVETYFATLKHHLHKHMLPMRAGRFIRDHLDVIDSKTNQFSVKLAMKNAKPRVQMNDTESDWDEDRKAEEKEIKRIEDGVYRKGSGRNGESNADSSADEEGKPKRMILSRLKKGFRKRFRKKNKNTHGKVSNSESEEPVKKMRGDANSADKRCRKGPVRGKDQRESSSDSGRRGLAVKQEVFSEDSDVLPERENEKWERKKQKSQRSRPQAPSTLMDLYRPKYGGTLNLDGKLMKIKNSCTLDCGMFIILAAFKTSHAVRDFMINMSDVGEDINIKGLMDMIRKMGERDGKAAKELCIELIKNTTSRFDGKTLEKTEFGKAFESGDFGGCESRFTDVIGNWFLVEQVGGCPKTVDLCTLAGVHRVLMCPSSELEVELKNSKTFADVLNYGRTTSCSGTATYEDGQQRRCDSKGIRITYREIVLPPLIVYNLPIGPGVNRNESELHMKQKIFGTSYRIFAYTLYSRSRDHFVAVIVHGNKRYVYDGLEELRGTSGLSLRKEYNGKVSTVFLLTEDE